MVLALQPHWTISKPQPGYLRHLQWRLHSSALPVLPSTGVRPATFRMKHFDISHDQCAMKMGTDAMLLGSWVHPQQAQRILDVGCGTGVLALMAAQRASPAACVDAIDVDADAYEQATQNVLASPWPTKVRVFHMGLQALVAQALAGSRPEKGPCTAASQLSSSGSGGGDSSSGSVDSSCSTRASISTSTSSHVAPLGTYDLIVSNPPFFTHSFKTLELAREARVARKRRQGWRALRSAPSLKQLTNQDDSNARSLQGQLRTASGPSGSEGVQGGGSACSNNGNSKGEISVPASAASISADNGGEDGLRVKGILGARRSYPEGLRTPQAQRVLARHADANQGLSYSELAEGARALLAPGGRLCVILPALQGEADEFAALAQIQGLVLERVLRVATQDEDPRERRRLMQFVKPEEVLAESSESDLAAPVLSGAHLPATQEQQRPVQEWGPLLITTRRKRVARRSDVVRCFSPEYLELTRDFHHPAFIKDTVVGTAKAINGPEREHEG